MRAIDIVRRLCRRARPNYVQAFEQGDEVMADYGLTTPLRLAHFLAQVFHETDGLTIERESGAYSASRLTEIFGVGRHSAAVTAAEARLLAKDGPAIFERVYGLGNPRKARELGNTKAGDGWLYRGNGILQTTGRGNHRRMGATCGKGALFEDQPELVTDPRYALLPALAEWRESACNALADRNDIAAITRRINGGYNGFADRKAWFARIYPLLEDGGTAWEDAAADDDIRQLQEQLNGLGYALEVDGRNGPATARAVRDFQARNGLRVDGIAGPLTLAKVAARLGGLKGEDDAAPDPLPGGKALRSGTVQAAATAVATGAIGLAGTLDVEQAASMVAAGKDVAGVVRDNQEYLTLGWLGYLAFGGAVAVGVFLIWKRLRDAGTLPRWLGGLAEAGA